ncbi:MAG: glycoside hydrolase family protein [Gammaproteobacteria bacterium]|nr:glycoside hydrolase family protein [Gammaproteobacteria bacterium]
MSLIDDLKRDEGFNGRPYKDTRGYWTIGYGHKLSNDVTIEYGDALRLANGLWTYLQAEQQLLLDIQHAKNELGMAIPWVRLLDSIRSDALINMAFNMGVHGVLGFHRMLDALEAGNWRAAHDEALDSDWRNQVGDRATRIANVFLTGVA